MKREGLDGPKLWDLADALAELGVPSSWSAVFATGLLERLWGYAAQHTPSGDLSKLTPHRIARGMGLGDAPAVAAAATPRKVIEILTEHSWLDRVGERLVVHDWREHCDRQVHRALVRRGETFWDGTPPTRSYLKDESQRRRWDSLWGDGQAEGGRSGVAPVVAPGADPGAPSRSRSRSQKEKNRNRSSLRGPRGPRDDDHEGSCSYSPEDELVLEIRERLRDQSTDSRNLRAIARTMPRREIEKAMHEAWARFRDGLVQNPTAYFVTTMQRRASELHVELGLRRGPKRIEAARAPRAAARGMT